jgi:cyclopropane fatty-acyl-phospholipid synthase-like methyltransferase
MKKLNTKEDLYNLLSASTVSAVLGTAIETGLLWRLAEGSLDGAGVAQALKIPLKRCQYWLQLLHSVGILEKGPQGYMPSDLTRVAILETYSQESWKHLALDERERSAGVHSLPLYISEPGSIWTAQGLPTPQDYVEKMRESPARAREFTRMLFEVHQNLANQIAELLDLTDVERMMDLGGGSGVVSMALLRKYPALTSTVVDIENVCVAGREIAAEEGFSKRISYHPTEFAKDEFPSGFDLVMQCDVTVFGDELLQKVWKSLKPGGRLIFVGHLSPAENYAPPNRVEWTFLDSLHDPNVSIPTVYGFKAQLQKTGFDVSDEQHTFGSGWIMLQARKREVM